MLEETLVELIGFIKNAAPEVWRVLMMQVRVEAVQYGLWAVAALVVFLVFSRWARSARFDEWFSEDEIRTLFWGITGFGAILAFVFASLVIGRLMNPEFYALRYLLERLP